MRCRCGIGGALLLALTVLASGCAGSEARKAAPSTTAVTASHVASVQGGYASAETFCAIPPLSGTIRYAVQEGSATFKLDVGGLPRRSLVAVEWINNTVRGYTVAAFSTDGNGRAQSGSLRMFRPGEVKAIGLRITTADVTSTVLGQLRQC